MPVMERRDEIMRKKTDHINIDDLYASYLRAGSIFVAGDEFGISGETVRRLLRKHGKKINRAKWTEYEISVMRIAYSNPLGVDVEALAIELGRPLAAIHCKADDVGITSPRGLYVRSPRARKNISAAQKLRAQKPGESERLSAQAKRSIQKYGHPRGMLGKKQSAAFARNQSERIKKRWLDPNDPFNSEEHRQGISDRSSRAAALRPVTNAFSRTKKGFRRDIGISVRSSWEANYARYLNFLIKQGKHGILRWEYEVDTFWFEKIRRGCRSYKPDFKVFLSDGSIEYHEVKGWMTPRSKTALNRMRIYHPKIKVVVVDQRLYKEIEKKIGRVVPLWEFPGR